MSIKLTYAPAAAVVGGAAYDAGLGQFDKWLAEHAFANQRQNQAQQFALQQQMLGQQNAQARDRERMAFGLMGSELDRRRGLEDMALKRGFALEDRKAEEAFRTAAAEDAFNRQKELYGMQSQAIAERMAADDQRTQEMKRREAIDQGLVDGSFIFDAPVQKKIDALYAERATYNSDDSLPQDVRDQKLAELDGRIEEIRYRAARPARPEERPKPTPEQFAEETVPLTMPDGSIKYVGRDRSGAWREITGWEPPDVKQSKPWKAAADKAINTYVNSQFGDEGSGEIDPARIAAIEKAFEDAHYAANPGDAPEGYAPPQPKPKPPTPEEAATAQAMGALEQAARGFGWTPQGAPQQPLPQPEAPPLNVTQQLQAAGQFGPVQMPEAPPPEQPGGQLPMNPPEQQPIISAETAHLYRDGQVVGDWIIRKDGQPAQPAQPAASPPGEKPWDGTDETLLTNLKPPTEVTAEELSGLSDGEFNAIDNLWSQTFGSHVDQQTRQAAKHLAPLLKAERARRYAGPQRRPVSVDDIDPATMPLLPKPKSKADFDKLDSGDWYIGTDGIIKQKP